MKVGQNLRNLREQNNMTLEYVAKKLNIAKQTLFKYEMEIITNIPLPRIEELANIYNVPPSKITGWEEEIKLPKNIIPLQKTRRIPILGTIAAGTPILAVENIQGYFIADNFIKGDFILEVIGDSMINANIFDKDLAFIRKQSTLENGEIGAILIEEEATLKKFTKKDGLVILQAANPDCTEYPKIFTEGNITILGKLVGIYSDRDR